MRGRSKQRRYGFWAPGLAPRLLVAELRSLLSSLCATRAMWLLPGLHVLPTRTSLVPYSLLFLSCKALFLSAFSPAYVLVLSISVSLSLQAVSPRFNRLFCIGQILPPRVLDFRYISPLSNYCCPAKTWGWFLVYVPFCLWEK